MNREAQLEEAICFAALNVPDAELRARFLERACAGDARLQAAVEELLLALWQILYIEQHNLEQMLKMLLEAGTDPNLVNSAGDSLVHVSARLGYFECLQMLYETRKCILINKNKLNQTALDIANGSIDESSLHVLMLFAEYKQDYANENALLRSVIDGRRMCAKYLAEKMIFDREEKVKNLVQSTLDDTNERRNKARIIRGIGGAKNTSFYADLTYNTKISRPPWEREDKEFFVGYHEGIDTVVRTVFACDYVNKSIRIGFHNVMHDGRYKMSGTTYPVPTAEAVIPTMVLPPEPEPTIDLLAAAASAASVAKSPTIDGASQPATTAQSTVILPKQQLKLTSRLQPSIGSGRSARAVLPSTGSGAGTGISTVASAVHGGRRASLTPTMSRQSPNVTSPPRTAPAASSGSGSGNIGSAAGSGAAASLLLGGTTGPRSPLALLQSQQQSSKRNLLQKRNSTRINADEL